jgi:S-DNA-T family DNA segregation ATPase FtsK/SpoIIIE
LKKEINFKTGGLLVAGGLLATAPVLGPAVYPVATAAAVEGMLLDTIFQESKYRKLFRLCGIENKDGKLPVIIKKQKKGNCTTLVLHLPEGLSQRHFEQKQEELEYHLNAKTEYGYNKNLILKLTDRSLKKRYDYEFKDCEKPLEVFCGYSHDGEFTLDIEKCPHAIVAGETNSGKSSLLRNMILSLILSEHDIDLHLIDFQAVELGIFENCRKVKSYGETPDDFEALIDELAEENEKRRKLFKGKSYIQNLSEWNRRNPDKTLPYKVVFIDEFARLAEKEYEGLLEKFRTRVSMDRKVGIHYIVAMQRPDVKCISGSIKANMPTRIAFRVVTQIDSEVILDTKGAEDIKEQGRFIAKYCGELKEVQAMYIDNVRPLLRGHMKTKEEIAAEKKERMARLREKCINPYLKVVE